MKSFFQLELKNSFHIKINRKTQIQIYFMKFNKMIFQERNFWIMIKKMMTLEINKSLLEIKNSLNKILYKNIV